MSAVVRTGNICLTALQVRTVPIGHIADTYSITLSARANKASGTITPIAFAVLRFITSSKLVAVARCAPLGMGASV